MGRKPVGNASKAGSLAPVVSGGLVYRPKGTTMVPFFTWRKFMKSPKIAVIGMGYVGLPLSVAFAEKYSVVGFDIKDSRINELMEGTDSTLEVSSDQLKKATSLSFSTSTSDIADCNIYIVTIPTPIDQF